MGRRRRARSLVRRVTFQVTSDAALYSYVGQDRRQLDQRARARFRPVLTVGSTAATVAFYPSRAFGVPVRPAMAKTAFVLLCASLCVQFALCQFGFFPQREDRRFNALGTVENFLQNPTRTLQAFLNFRPNRGNQNRPGIINGPYYQDQYGNYPNNFNPNEYYYNSINYPNREYNNGKNVVFEPTVTNNPFEYDVNPNKVTDNSNQGFTTGRSNEFTINIVEEADDKPDNGQNFGDDINGVPNPPPAEFNNENGESVNDDNNSNAPSGFEDNNGIPSVPPSGFEDRNDGIPNVPPPGVDVDGIPSSQTVSETSQTTLPPLTPVPATASKNNFNFGTQGLFLESCETVDGGSGSCIVVNQCEPYLKLLQQSQTNPSVVQILRKAHCGFDGSNPKVCCPRPGIPTIPPTEVATEAPETTTEPPRPSAKSLTDGDYVDSLPEPPQCGVSNASFTRVVGGVDAKLGDFPWVALLGYQGRRKQGTRWLCGGSLVSSKHVLTAAHCIHGHEDDLYLVRVGELDLARDDDGATPVDVLIKRKIKHEEYSPKAFTNDIGILVLEREISFTALIRPICIPVDSELRARSYVDYNPIIAGWGDTEFRGPAATHLQALQLPVVTNEQCAQAYTQYKAQTIDERVLCAGYKNGGKDACQGDSGGPLMQPIWNSKKFTTHFYQIGVVSYGKRCAEAGFPGVYTRVTHFVPWLQEKMLGKA
ncbi:unnamed protein product, partial [Iphiclides podalirius]